MTIQLSINICNNNYAYASAIRHSILAYVVANGKSIIIG